jgi:hypothetical protein
MEDAEKLANTEERRKGGNPFSVSSLPPWWIALFMSSLPSPSAYEKKGHHPFADDGPWSFSCPAYFIR